MSSGYYNDVMTPMYVAHGDTLPDQYFDVGRLFALSLRREVAKIGAKKTKQARARKEIAQKSLTHLQQNPLLDDFFACLQSWSDGAGIRLVEAMWLLADNFSGCQTFMARYSQGIALLHTEEDFVNIRERMNDVHTVSFHVDGQDLRCLVYNDLLPGAGLFGWQKNLMVAVDALFLKEDGVSTVEKPLLVNIVAWLVWRMKPTEASPERILEVIRELGELVDGYAINIVRLVDGTTEGFKLTLARSESQVEYLADAAGSFLAQVNIVDPQYPTMQWDLPPRNLWKGGHRYFTERLKKMRQRAREYKQVALLDTSKIPLTLCHQRIQEALFTDLRDDCINNDVGAVCVGLLTESHTSVSTKLHKAEPVKVLEYIDQL